MPPRSFDDFMFPCTLYKQLPAPSNMWLQLSPQLPCIASPTRNSTVDVLGADLRLHLLPGLTTVVQRTKCVLFTTFSTSSTSSESSSPPVLLEFKTIQDSNDFCDLLQERNELSLAKYRQKEYGYSPTTSPGLCSPSARRSDSDSLVKILLQLMADDSFKMLVNDIEDLLDPSAPSAESKLLRELLGCEATSPQAAATAISSRMSDVVVVDGINIQSRSQRTQSHTPTPPPPPQSYSHTPQNLPQQKKEQHWTTLNDVPDENNARIGRKVSFQGVVGEVTSKAPSGHFVVAFENDGFSEFGPKVQRSKFKAIELKLVTNEKKKEKKITKKTDKKMVHRKLSDLPKSERTEGLRVSFEGNKGTTGPLRRNKDKSLCERPFTGIFDYAINMKTAYRGGELFLLDDLLDETTMTSSSGDDDDDESIYSPPAKRRKAQPNQSQLPKLSQVSPQEQLGRRVTYNEFTGTVSAVEKIGPGEGSRKRTITVDWDFDQCKKFKFKSVHLGLLEYEGSERRDNSYDDTYDELPKLNNVGKESYLGSRVSWQTKTQSFTGVVSAVNFEKKRCITVCWDQEECCKILYSPGELVLLSPPPPAPPARRTFSSPPPPSASSSHLPTLKNSVEKESYLGSKVSWQTKTQSFTGVVSAVNFEKKRCLTVCWDQEECCKIMCSPGELGLLSPPSPAPPARRTFSSPPPPSASSSHLPTLKNSVEKESYLGSRVSYKSFTGKVTAVNFEKNRCLTVCWDQEECCKIIFSPGELGLLSPPSPAPPIRRTSSSPPPPSASSSHLPTLKNSVEKESYLGSRVSYKSFTGKVTAVNFEKNRCLTVCWDQEECGKIMCTPSELGFLDSNSTPQTVANEKTREKLSTLTQTEMLGKRVVFKKLRGVVARVSPDKSRPIRVQWESEEATRFVFVAKDLELAHDQPAQNDATGGLSPARSPARSPALETPNKVSLGTRVAYKGFEGSVSKISTGNKRPIFVDFDHPSDELTFRKASFGLSELELELGSGHGGEKGKKRRNI